MGIDTARNQKKEKHQRFAAETGVFDRIGNPDFIFTLPAGNAAMQEHILAEDTGFTHRAADRHHSRTIAGIRVPAVRFCTAGIRCNRTVIRFDANADILGGYVGYAAMLRKRFAAIDAGRPHIPQTARGQHPGIEAAQESVSIFFVIIRRNDARLTQITAIHALER